MQPLITPFNTQEVVLGLIHRAASTLLTLSPITFYISTVFALYGMSLAVLFLLAVQLTGWPSMLPWGPRCLLPGLP